MKAFYIMCGWNCRSDGVMLLLVLFAVFFQVMFEVPFENTVLPANGKGKNMFWVG